AARKVHTVSMPDAGRRSYVAWSPDGKQLALSRERMVEICDPTTWQKALTLRGHTDFITSVAWSPDGKRLASASLDLAIKVWDVTQPEENLALGKPGERSIRCVAWSPDGKRLAVSAVPSRPNEMGVVTVWDVAARRELLTVEGDWAAWSP